MFKTLQSKLRALSAAMYCALLLSNMSMIRLASLPLLPLPSFVGGACNPLPIPTNSNKFCSAVVSLSMDSWNALSRGSLRLGGFTKLSRSMADSAQMSGDENENLGARVEI